MSTMPKSLRVFIEVLLLLLLLHIWKVSQEY
jgi:hypothetical protein